MVQKTEITERLEEYTDEELMSYLGPTELQFAGARLCSSNDEEAAELIDRAGQTVRNWNNVHIEDLNVTKKQVVNEIVRRFRAQYVIIAKKRLESLTNKAVDVLEDALGGKGTQLQLTAAREVLDRAGAKGGIEITGKDGEPLVDNRAIIIQTVRELLPPVQIVDGKLVEETIDGT